MRRKIKVFLWLIVISVINGYDLEEINLVPRLTNVVAHSENEVCKVQTKLYKDHLKNLTLWAHEMWDASAKYPVGFLRGNSFQLGDWDECLTIDGPYRTQYCLATISASVPSSNPPRDPKSLYYEPFERVLNKIHKTEEISVQSRHAIQMGLCIPAACSSRDLENSLNEYLSTTEFPLEDENVTYNAKVVQDLCQTDADQNNYDSLDIAFCFLTLIIVLLVIASTLYDYYKRDEDITADEKHNKLTFSNKVCLAFSARKNFLDLPKADESNPALSTLYGIKVFSMFMIIMDHRFGIFIAGPVINFDYIEQQYRSKFAAILFHGDLFVDTFFVLSGLLVMYGLSVQFEKKILNPFFVIFLRYIRLTPVYAFVLFYWATMFNHIGSGPLWKVVIQPKVANCRNNWWTNLLYVNNYVNDEHMCMLHSWYLPCDFHFFIIGTIIVLVLTKHKRLGLSLIAILLVLSLIIPFVLTFVYLRPAMLLFYPSNVKVLTTHPDFRLTYTKTHARAASYIIGMISGYIYYRLKGSNKRLSKISSHALTLGSVFLIFVCIASGAIFYNPYHKYNAIEAGAYAALHRVAWSVGTVGLLFSASYGHATVLKSVLSWSPWIPLGKLVYGAYLIHTSYQFRSIGMASTPKYFTYFDVISLAFGDIVLAFLFALFLYLGIEAPIRKIFKELLTPIRSTDQKLGSETAGVEQNEDESGIKETYRF